MKKIIVILTIIFLSAQITYAQAGSISVGTAMGVGEIKSNSPATASFGGSLFLNVKPPFAEDYSFRFNFIYARHIDYFLPENSINKYYPFMKAFTLKIFTEQTINGIIFSEEGIGPLILNDRTFSDINVWNFGLSFSVLIGLNFENDDKTGFRLGIGIDYGNTFNNTAANYYSTNIQVQYTF